jgi:tetratricopeptide (TPR) repeat protein
VKLTPIVLIAAVQVLAAGCGLVPDMRSEYIANRALGQARAELASAAPQRHQALAELDLAFRLRSHDERFLARLAAPYLAAGDYERALRCYAASVKVNGDSHDLELGMCYMGLGKSRFGLARLDKALLAAAERQRRNAIAPDAYARVLNDVGYTWVDAEVRVEEALSMIEDAVRIAPMVPAYIDSLGWAYYRLGDDERAAFYLERAARLVGREDAEMLWHLGAVHARLRQFRRAESELERALRLDPTNEQARSVLRQLQRELPPPAEV